MNVLKVLRSFPHAFRGIQLALRERNMQVHVLAVIVVTVSGISLGISVLEWLIVMVCFSLVLSLETVNTAFERVCNHLRDDLGLSYQATKDARDIAAGAVLVAAIISVLVGIVIFVPRLLDLFVF